MLVNIDEKINALDSKLNAYASGLQSACEMFDKYKASRIDDLVKVLDQLDKSKNVTGFDIDVQSYPMDILIRLKISTNFGEISYKYNYPPFAEHNIGQSINGTYQRLLDDLYDAHAKRGGKFMGEQDCKKWMDDNGKTIIDANIKQLPQVS